jgi:hypothetical protein
MGTVLEGAKDFSFLHSVLKGSREYTIGNRGFFSREKDSGCGADQSHLVRKSGMAEIYLHFTIRHQGGVLM